MKTTDADFPSALHASAEAWVGTPFARLHSTLGIGADCTGLVYGVLVDAGVELPDMGAPTFGQSADINFAAVIEAFLLRMDSLDRLDDLGPDLDVRAGDLLLYQITRRTQHLTLALDDRTQIQAWPRREAEIVAFDGLWARKLVGHWRLRDGG